MYHKILKDRMSNLSKQNIKFIEAFWETKIYKSGETENDVFFSYVSHVGKYNRSNILDQILVQEFTPIEVFLWTAIMANLKCSKNYIISGVVNLSYNIYSKYCSNRVFFQAKKKYVRFNLLHETKQSKWYIVNPLYTGKIYKTKKSKWI